MHFLYFILIGLDAGWLAGQITKGGGFGLVGDLIIGVIGSVVGGFVFGLLGLGTTSLIGALVTATVGAILLILGLGWLKRNNKI